MACSDGSLRSSNASFQSFATSSDENVGESAMEGSLPAFKSICDATNEDQKKY